MVTFTLSPGWIGLFLEKNKNKAKSSSARLFEDFVVSFIRVLVYYWNIRRRKVDAEHLRLENCGSTVWQEQLSS